MKRISSLLLALVLTVSLAVPAMAAGFTDVPSSHGFFDAINDCAAKGITSGYSDGSFRPAAPVTNAQFAVMLSRAFFQKNVDALAPQADGKPWYWANLKAMDGLGLLQGTSFSREEEWPASAGQGISRYDMAQIIANIMSGNGKTVSAAEKAAAQASISDWAQIPAGYRDAVSSVFALGIIGGYSGGVFGGERTMNRGQGCVVIQRLSRALDSAAPETPAQPETPPAEEKPTEISVSTQTDNSGNTVWTVGDNGHPTGYLNNGKPITEENVLAMLQTAKAQWPTGMSWNGTYKNTNCYNSEKGESVACKLMTKHYCDTGYACSGFAAMLSDYIFGKTGNPVRKLDDNTQVRPGDIVIYLDPTGSVEHVNIAMTTVGTTRGGNPGVRTANGNTGGQVEWRDTAKNYTDRIDDYDRTPGQTCKCVIYTRYPA